MELLDELVLLVGKFEERKVPYALCGGLAVAIYGAPQCSIDIEFLVAEPDICRAKAAAALAGFGYESQGDRSMLSSAIRLFKIAGDAFQSLDLIVADETQASLLTNPLWITHADRRLAVISKSGLIAMKSQSLGLRDRQELEDLADAESMPIWNPSRERGSITPDVALRLSRAFTSDASPAAVEMKLDKLRQANDFWRATRESRLAAGIPSPYDLPPKDIRPIQLG